MKQIIHILFVLLLLTGCTVKREVVLPSNDFSEQILQNVSREALTQLRSLGVTLYDGKTPPNLEGIFLLSPNVMTKSTVPDDKYKPGDQFANYRIKIYQQNNQALTTSLDSKAVDSEGKAIALTAGQNALISGSGNNFTIFVISEYKSSSNTTKSRLLEVYSGQMTDAGVLNMQNALLMLDDYGDPNNELIPINTGRSFKDNDGTSERISTFRLPASDQATPVIPMENRIYSFR